MSTAAREILNEVHASGTYRHCPNLRSVVPESVLKRMTGGAFGLKKPLHESLDPPRGHVATDVYRVLIVEDDEVDRELVAETFARMTMGVEFDLMFASDGDEALELIESGSANAPEIDLVILDLNLPGTDGWDVLDQVAKDWLLNTPIIVFTSSRSERDEAYALERNVKAFVPKPEGLGDLGELERAIRREIR